MLRFILGKTSPLAWAGVAFAQAATVLRYEMELARLEFERKIKGMVQGAVMIAISIAILVFAIGLMVLAGVVALAEIWPLWLACLAVGGALLLIALIFVGAGTHAIKTNSDLRPDRAVRALHRFTRR